LKAIDSEIESLQGGAAPYSRSLIRGVNEPGRRMPVLSSSRDRVPRLQRGLLLPELVFHLAKKLGERYGDR
jgi:hypothetical protein